MTEILASIWANKVVRHTGDDEISGSSQHKWNSTNYQDSISFSKLDIITPSQKLLARQLTFEIVPGKSLLVTG